MKRSKAGKKPRLQLPPVNVLYKATLASDSPSDYVISKLHDGIDQEVNQVLEVLKKLR